MNIFTEIQEYSILIKALENSRLPLDIERRRYYIKKKNQLIDEAAKNLNKNLGDS
jgi:tRNA G37 N-methylase TrmD